MTVQEIMTELKKKGSENIKKIFLNHGAKEPLYGVRIADLKTIQKKIKKDHQLAMDLFNTGNYDARYLAGLIADESKMSKKDIQSWAENAGSPGISEYTVAWVAAESPFGWELGLEWISSRREDIAVTGWNTLTGVIAMKPDDELDIPTIKKLLMQIEKDIHNAPNLVRYTMNNFVIGVGCYMKELSSLAIGTGKKIGNVTVNMGNTACKVPFAPDYINKAKAKGIIGKKRKTVKC